MSFFASNNTLTIRIILNCGTIKLFIDKTDSDNEALIIYALWFLDSIADEVYQNIAFKNWKEANRFYLRLKCAKKNRK